MSVDVVHVSALRRARHVARTLLAEHPAVYLPLARRRYPGPSPQVIGPDTQLVIDGYTRCASTFAVYSFQLAQPEPVRVAHHLHAPAQLIAAARRGIPTVVLIREPEAALLSHVVREPWVDLRDAAFGFARFYNTLLPYRDAFVVADADEVTGDFGSVVRRLNATFGTAFAGIDGDRAEAAARVMTLMRHRASLQPELLGWESGTVTFPQLTAAMERDPDRFRAKGDEDDLWVPSASREERKHAYVSVWRSDMLAAARAATSAAYARFRGD